MQGANQDDGKIRVFVVHQSRGNFATYGPRVLDRISKFVRKYDLDADPGMLVAHVSHQMYVENPPMIVIAAVLGDRMVGHGLAVLETYYGTVSVVVSQIEIDRDAQAGRSQAIRDGMDIVSEWARAAGASIAPPDTIPRNENSLVATSAGM